jgi:hypothetical protein
MASNFKGYLLKFGDVELPNSYLVLGGSESTPKQREEIEAYRDDDSRTLHRVTASGKKTSQKFKFRSLTDTQLKALKNVMNNSLVSAKERKYTITYWDDENLQYDSGDFYIPDITYTRKRIDEKKNILYYDEFEMEIIEY